MKPKRKRIALIASILVVAIALGGLLGTRLWAQRSNIFEALHIFNTILNIVQQNYVKEVDAKELIQSAIKGMLGSLDPYSVYMNAEEFKDLRAKTEAEFGGIGIQIGLRDNILTVISPIEGTPAYRVGMRSGDKIVKIDSEPTEGFTLDEAVKRLRGKPGTKVEVEVTREGLAEPIHFTIVREIIKIKAVPYAGKLTDEIGYIRLADFSRVAAPELSAALDSLFAIEGIKKLVLDLRSNSGGLLQEGVEVSGLFIPKGDTVVITKGRSPTSVRGYVADQEPKYGSFPLVVLVDRGSASATEIVAGAIQDWERGLILGDTTFGKGSVQTLYPLPEDAALKLTSAYWYTPSGRCINRPTKKDTSKKQSEKKITYYTLGKAKRPIYGEGAIAPDVYVPYERLSDFESKLITKAVIFEFANKYTARNPNLPKGFKVTGEMLQEVKEIAQRKDIKFTDAQFDSSAEFIKREIEREVALKLWGNNGEYEARLKYDPQVKKAVELLTKAKSVDDLFKVAGR
ncbi:MAG: S41 family peptidase [candidate division WOR-3 bacterium]